ncbi:MAG TPA: hypothetical protein VG603_01880, partial [Chitinophagales bacterium]|nr:hypothetical protein [Chitinophagales bacterium]
IFTPVKIKNMVAVPLLILAFAAGVYLLMKATREFMGPLFKGLAWLIIILSLLALIGGVVRHAHHCHGSCRDNVREERMIIRDMGDGHCMMDSAMASGCCKMMGDSVLMDSGMCCKMMGKETCEKMMHERGRCIMSKEECAKACGGQHCCMGMGNEMGKCGMAGKPCEHTEGKSCCKKK